jgi:hypothetical protein
MTHDQVRLIHTALAALYAANGRKRGQTASQRDEQRRIAEATLAFDALVSAAALGFVK